MKKLITIMSLCLCVSIGIMIGCGTDGTGNANDLSAVWSEINALWDEINMLKGGEDSVEMQEYAAPVGMDKTFEQTGSPTTLTSVVTGDGTETWTYSDGSEKVYLTADSPEGTMLIGREEYNTSGVMTQDLTYVPAVLGMNTVEPKTKGTQWGNAYVAIKPDGSQYGAETNLYSFIGIESVTVPAGTFADCIVVHVTTQNYKYMAWLAPGVGMVKRIGVEGLFELQNYTP